MSDSFRSLDYSVLQQCMHCGMCLPTCPTYGITLQEKNSPRGRISLMRAIADGKLEATQAFGEEMYYCLGCLACETACPAGVEYGLLFETARAEAERSGTLTRPARSFWRNFFSAASSPGPGCSVLSDGYSGSGRRAGARPSSVPCASTDSFRNVTVHSKPRHQPPPAASRTH